jgi:phosphoribosylamine--glycine ligase
MNILIIGSGGREYTLGWKIKQSKKAKNIFFIPGNGGTNLLGKNININILDFDNIKNFIQKENIDLVVVGPEQPLIAGITDFLKSNLNKKTIIIGPSQKGAMLEGSKDFAKQFMQKYNIPTAKYKSFDKNSYLEACKFLEKLQAPYVLKADGPAAGKGVLIIDNIEEAKNKLKEIFDGKFGNAGNKVVIEQFLNGTELSIFIITDGKNYKILPSSKDYKRIGEADTGLNTGGMGAVSPVPFVNKNLLKNIEQKIIIPTIKGLQKENIEYIGFLYFGLMIKDNEAFVIEYNARLGDPETQVVIPRIKNDLLEILIATSTQNLDKIKIEEKEQTAITIIIASGGYPEKYEKNKIISGLENSSDCLIFHAGTSLKQNKFYTNGGRVLAITAFGSNINEARNIAYNTVNKINFDKKYYRKDIGLDLI